MKQKILVVFGTRPEAVKMCPLIDELKKRTNIECIVCLTGQHKEMLIQVMTAFKIREDFNLNIMKNNQTVGSITTEVLEKLDGVLEEVKPNIVLVHGDTTTSFAAALAAFYRKIPVGHVEAGLRTGNKYSPYPEEMNRCLISKIATLHFAPTTQNAQNLKYEGILKGVYITGNTVIDSFKYTIKDDYSFENQILNGVDFSKRIILLTAHRRENMGLPLKNIFSAIVEIANRNKDIIIIYPVHLNPYIREEAKEMLGKQDNIILIDPINIFDMHNLIKRCFLVLTDSGGIQEEAPALGKPVLVLRHETERPEAVLAGNVKIIGTEKKNIVENTQKLLDSEKDYIRMSNAISPYGDGFAAKRIVDIIENSKSI